MSFTSINFVVFLIALFILYYSLPKKMQWVVLLVASYVFYIFAGVKLAFVLVATTGITFSTGMLLGRINENYENKLEVGGSEITKEEKIALKVACKKEKKTVIFWALLVLFGILIFFKYYNFIALNTNQIISVFSPDTLLPTFSIILPIGISFYIFQSTGYVIDVFRNKFKPDTNFYKFALFVSFFPQIIQGPIGRYDKLAHQLYGEHNLDFTNIKFGIQLALWGLFKKIIIADRLAIPVKKVFDNYTDYGGTVIFLIVIFYCIQIYCDFSGGVDIARGIAKALGISMSKNFARPYFASSVSDFWRRWHISLGSWMRDYLFYPLAFSSFFAKLGKKARKTFGVRIGKILPSSLATLIVFTVIGLWHGANWKYIFFGFFNGVIITFSLICEPYYAQILEKLKIKKEGSGWKLFSIGRTFLITCLGRYFTRASSLIVALSMLKRTLFTPNISQAFDGTIFSLGIGRFDYLIVFISVIVLILVSYIQEKGFEIRKELEIKSGKVQLGIMILAVLFIVMFGIYREGYIASQFIYAQF